MKNFLIMLTAAAMLCSCNNGLSEEEDVSEVSKVSIYGVVVDGESGEPQRTITVQLHKKGRQISENKYEYNLLTSTVTFDDGHFEFKDIKPDDYRLTISSSKYMTVNYNLTVEPERSASVDIAMLNSENATDKWVQIEDILVLLEDTGEEMTWDTAKAVAEGTTVSGEKNWRLPTRAELAMLYKYKASLNMADEDYWTREIQSYTSKIFYMNMLSGRIGELSPNLSSYYTYCCRVRLVKSI